MTYTLIIESRNRAGDWVAVQSDVGLKRLDLIAAEMAAAQIIDALCIYSASHRNGPYQDAERGRTTTTVEHDSGWALRITVAGEAAP
jgi:hypothetical protein